MPTNTLIPTANGADTAWSLGAGASKWQACITPDDADTTYILSTTNLQRMSFVLGNLPAEAVAVRSHTLTRRARKAVGAAGDTVNSFLLLSGSYTHGSAVNPAGSYTDYESADLARPGGGLWSVADVNAAEAGVRYNGTGGDENRVTTLKWAVEWSAEEGGWASFVGGIVGPVVGAALLLHDIARLAAMIRQKTHGRTIILPAEWPAMLAGMRHPRRRYAL
ncbi:MAG: hypothetical protein A3E78_01970 [Alphaproteobacteria bacterium RIFCSPHIGHO2_12_FULL_63_12]|nr:MAG: hypothetical protein A3E78_01970 [Alphaproteobacteria bacterium RIFCSPHIGHO2_12_FULL_63_12]